MILILKTNATDEQVDHVLQRVEALGLQHHLSRGTHRTIVGIIGDEDKLREDSLRSIPGVAKVVPVMPAYKLASRDAHPDPSIVDVSGTKIGGGHLGLIAGPCSVEDPDRMFRIAERVSKSGANLFRDECRWLPWQCRPASWKEALIDKQLCVGDAKSKQSFCALGRRFFSTFLITRA